MPSLVLDQPALEEGHRRAQTFLRAGLVDLLPVIRRAAHDMKEEILRQISTEGDGTWAPRSRNTLLTSPRALGGLSGSVARTTRAIGVESDASPRAYALLVYGSDVGLFMQGGTRAHTIVAHNPSGRLAFAVVPDGGLRHVSRGERAGYTSRIRVLRREASGLLRPYRGRSESVARTAAAARARVLRGRAKTQRGLREGMTLVRPQRVNHPGTPPRSFARMPEGWTDVHLWEPMARYIELAATGTVG